MSPILLGVLRFATRHAENNEDAQCEEQREGVGQNGGPGSDIFCARCDLGAGGAYENTRQEN